MSKSISERIAERVKHKKGKSASKNRSDFLSILPEIEEALKDNWSVRSVWETLYEEGKISFKYMTFLRYSKLLSKELKKRNTRKAPTASTKIDNGKTKAFTKSSISHDRSSSISDFNPVPNPKEIY